MLVVNSPTKQPVTQVKTPLEYLNQFDYRTKAGTIEAIHCECARVGLGLPAQVAYVLATVDHETGGTFKPVYEAHWLKNPFKYLRNLAYYPYYGRGFVQLTWKANYAKYGKKLGIDLVSKPELAQDPAVAVFILVDGFRHGEFTGKKLEDYVTANECNFTQARRCINGTDKAQHIALLAVNYRKQLEAGKA